jgi:lipoate-protein ligase B
MGAGTVKLSAQGSHAQATELGVSEREAFRDGFRRVGLQAPAGGSREVVAVDLGRIAYAEALALQRRLARARQLGEAPDMLLLCEHPPVVTLGRASRPQHLLAGPAELARRGVACVEVERGGDVTYHGPGQLVGYPILDLRGHGEDLHRYLRTLEAVLIGVAARFGVEAARVPGKTGVWVGHDAARPSAPEAGAPPAGAARKLASIGVHVSRWITWHGFALNVTGEALSGFDLIVPCGLSGVRMTSLEAEGGRGVSLAEAAAAVRESFADVFGVEVAAAGLAAVADDSSKAPRSV